MSSEERFQPTNFNRPPRIPPPALPKDDIDIPAPPNLPDLPEQNWLVSIIPVMGIGVMALFYVFRSFGSSGGSALFAIPLLILAIFTIGGTILTQRWRHTDYEKRRYESTLNYIRLLEKKRARLQAAHNAQIALLETNFPNPEDGLELVLSRDARLWERRPNDPDFTAFRLGLGHIPFPMTITTPDPDVDSEELDRALQIADTYRTLDHAPAVLSLQQSHSLGFYGKREVALPAIRGIICQLALAHTPQDLKVHLIAPQADHDNWRWLEWLPHVHINQQTAADLLAFDPDSIRNLLGNLSQTIDQRKEHKEVGAIPHTLVIVDDPRLAEGEPVYETLLREGYQVGASILCIVNRYEDLPGDCHTIIEIGANGSFHAHSGAQSELTGIIDRLSTQNAEHIARALAAVSIRQTGGSGRIPRQVDFLDLYGVHSVDDLTGKITRRWRRQIPNGALPYPVPIGQESLAVSTTILLDEAHHGPHGVLAGTTGSGKSGLLQSFICAMAIEHDPRLATFLLIDFKGGSTFNVFDSLPHTVGTVTNLDVVLVERALEAIKAETQARQQFLKRNNVRDIMQYHRYFARTDKHLQDPSYQPLPHLFIIVDEFAQLAKEMPDFLRELVRTAQVGRSLGLHLILGTQSPMDVITDEMNANMQFRICLRVQNIEASRAMLRRPDAAYLPAGWPGRGYFQVGERSLFKQFQAAFVGGDYEQPDENKNDGRATENTVLELITDDGAVVDLLALGDGQFAPPKNTDTILTDEPYTTVRAISEMVVAYTRQNNIPWMPPILLPPLDEQITLVAPLEKASTGGWNGRNWQAPGKDHADQTIATGSAPVGLIDDIYNRTQHPLWVHFNTGEQESGRDGHLLVIGGPGTGKTTFLRTLAISQAILHAPDQLHMYFLSFMGGGLNDVSQLPHAETVVHGTETERVRRLFGRLIHILDARQSGRSDGDQPTIMLCIDQYEQFRDSYFDQHSKDFERLIYEGRAVGIYLALTASSISAIPDRLRSLIQQRIALQLGNPSDYMLAVGHLNTRVERVLPRGRGYIYHSPPLVCQISLPSLQSPARDDDDIRHEMRSLIDNMCNGYLAQQGIPAANATKQNTQSPPPILELPLHIPLETLPVYKARERDRIITPLGRSDDDALSVFNLDWWEDGPHFIVTGPPGSGKSTLLQAAALSAAQQFSPDNLRFLVVDFSGRNLRSLTSLKHVIGRVADVLDLQKQLANLDAELQTFQAQWHNDKTRTLPYTIILFDDYDITSEVLSTHNDLLRRLRDHVRLHSELGLHIWLAGYLERIGDPLIKQLLLKRSGFGFSVRDSLHNLNIRITDLSNEAMPEGRVYFARHNTIDVIQTVLVENPQQLVNHINQQLWPNHDAATWQQPAQFIVPARPQKKTPPESEGDPAIDIDTDGLIDDLFGS